MSKQIIINSNHAVPGTVLVNSIKILENPEIHSKDNVLFRIPVLIILATTGTQEGILSNFIM